MVPADRKSRANESHPWGVIQSIRPSRDDCPAVRLSVALPSNRQQRNLEHDLIAAVLQATLPVVALDDIRSPAKGVVACASWPSDRSVTPNREPQGCRRQPLKSAVKVPVQGPMLSVLSG